MASTQITTITTDGFIPWTPQGAGVTKAGARLYAAYNSGTAMEYRYSDDDGATWSAAVTVKASGAYAIDTVYDSVNGRINFFLSGNNNAGLGLILRAIKTNITSGTPGSLTTETVIDAGGANLGVEWAYAFHSPTSSRPRYWVIASKYTDATHIETRAYHVNVTTATDADTAGNWVTTNFTNLGGNSNAEAAKQGIGFYWTVGGLDKVTLIFGTQNTAPTDFGAVTFDPTAATPTPGTVTSSLFALGGTGGTFDQEINGPPITACAIADYAVFGRLDRNTGAWQLYKSVNGTTWTTPAGWSITAGRAQLALAGTDMYVVHSHSYGAAASTAIAMFYRLITTASDNMGGATSFSDQNGNIVSVPRDTGTSKLYGIYRGSTASPYTLRSDFVSIGGAVDTTPPGQATVTVGTVTNTTVPLALVMPADIDVAEYEVRYLTGSTAPATNRSNGTVAVAATATAANEIEAETITGLTTGTRISGRVFVKDVSGNWNTGIDFTAVPVDWLAFVGRYQADGTTPVADDLEPGGNNLIVVYQMAATCFDSAGGSASFRLRIGYNNVTPPSQSFFDLISGPADGTFEYEASAGTWTTVPSGGLSSTHWAKKLRVHTGTSQGTQYGSIRVEQ